MSTAGGVGPPDLKKRRTDLDAQAFGTILSTLGPSERQKIFERAQQGWCGFHRISRGLEFHPDHKSYLDSERSNCIWGRLEIDMLITFMWYFIKFYRTREEVEMASHLMNYYMREDDQSDHLAALKAATCSNIVEWLCKSFFIHSDMLFESSFEGMTMCEVCTSINESWHRAVKRVEGGPSDHVDAVKSVAVDSVLKRLGGKRAVGCGAPEESDS